MESILTTVGDYKVVDDVGFTTNNEPFLLQTVGEKQPPCKEAFENWVEKGCSGVQVSLDTFLVDAALLRVMETKLPTTLEMLQITHNQITHNPKFNEMVLNNSNREIGLEPQIIQVFQPPRRDWECEKAVYVFNQGIPENHFVRAIFMCLKGIRVLKKESEEYIVTLKKSALKYDQLKAEGQTPSSYKDLFEPNCIPWRKVRDWRRLICSFTHVLWQWITTYTDVAFLARGVKAWCSEVTHWAHLNQYPMWLKEQKLLLRWEDSKDLQPLAGPHPQTDPIVKLSFYSSSSCTNPNQNKK